MPNELDLYRGRFLPKKLEVNVDGQSEEWIYEANEVEKDILHITYKLKNKIKYKTEL